MDYTAGLTISLLIASTAGILLFLVCAFAGQGLDHLFDWLLAFFLSVIGVLSVFAVVYAIANFLAQTNITAAETVQQEFRTGVIGLRVSSVLIGAKTILRLIDNVLTEHTLWIDRLQWGARAGYKDLDDLSEVFDRETRNWVVISQSGIYLAVITCLWGITIAEVETTTILVLNWAFFFVVDDWIIIATQMEALKGRILAVHRIRIAVFNAILVGLLGYVLFTEFGWVFASGVSVVLLLLLFWRYMPIAILRKPKGEPEADA